MQMHLSSFLIILFTLGGVQARPLFDFLPPVIINEEQRITTNNNAHTTIFFPVEKYSTDVYYQIIRIPIHLGPIEAGFKRAGEILQYMKNLIKGKATKILITQIIGHHKKNPEQNQRGVQKHPQQSTGSTIHTLWITQEEVSGSSIWDCWNGFWSGESNRNYQDQLSNFEKHPQDRYVGRYHTTS